MNNIDYNKYISEQLGNINYNEYISEQLGDIDYSKYFKNITKSIRQKIRIQKIQKLFNEVQCF